MKFEISRSIYPDGKIRFIARDKDRIIRFREETLEELQKAIKTYKEPPPVVEGEEEEPKEKKFLTNKLAEKVQERKEEQEAEHPEGEEEKKQPKKKSFWDRLK